MFSRFLARAHFYDLSGDLWVARAPVFLVGLIFDTKKRTEKGRAGVCEGLRHGGGGGSTMEQLSTQGDAFQHQFTPAVPKGTAADQLEAPGPNLPVLDPAKISLKMLQGSDKNRTSQDVPWTVGAQGTNLTQARGIMLINGSNRLINCFNRY